MEWKKKYKGKECGEMGGNELRWASEQPTEFPTIQFPNFNKRLERGKIVSRLGTRKHKRPLRKLPDGLEYKINEIAPSWSIKQNIFSNSQKPTRRRNNHSFTKLILLGLCFFYCLIEFSWFFPRTRANN